MDTDQLGMMHAFAQGLDLSENGQALARLSSAGGQNFNGQTTSGQPISLSR